MDRFTKIVQLFGWNRSLCDKEHFLLMPNVISKDRGKKAQKSNPKCDVGGQRYELVRRSEFVYPMPDGSM